MKTFLFLAVLFMTFSCEHDTGDDNSNSTEVISKGLWKVSFYKDRDKEETSNYALFLFDFSISGKVIATNSNGQIFEGTISLGTDDSKSKMIIGFKGNSLLEEISEDWEIVKKDDNIISLYHKSGGDGHESFLKFIKK